MKFSEGGNMFVSVWNDFESWWKENGDSVVENMDKVSATYRDLALTVWMEAQPKWQPIETAPVDGTEILLLTDDKVKVLGSYSKDTKGFGQWVCCQDRWQHRLIEGEVTHWFLPPNP